MNAIELILAQRGRDGGAENCQNRQEPGCAVSPGLGGLRIPPPRMLVRCRGGDALGRGVVPVSLTVLGTSGGSFFCPCAECTEPLVGTEWGIWDQGGRRWGRQQNPAQNRGADPQKLTSCRKKNQCLSSRVLMRKIASYC